MGGCASKPKDLDGHSEPLPTPVTPKKAADEAVPQVEKDGGETKKEEPLVDVSEPPPEVPKSEESSSKAADVKDVFEEAKPSEDVKPVAEPTSEPKAEAAKQAPKEEEKKEVIADGVTKKPQNDASSPKDKSDAPLVTV